MTDDYRVILVDLPTRIRSYVVYCKNDYTIFINARLNDVQRLKAYEHELWHIEQGDCVRTVSADLIEVCAHKEDAYVEN